MRTFMTARTLGAGALLVVSACAAPEASPPAMTATDAGTLLPVQMACEAGEAQACEALGRMGG